MKSKTSTTISKGDREYIRSNKDMLKELPEPSETFVRKELSDHYQTNFLESVHRNIVIEVDETKLESHVKDGRIRNYRVKVWQTNARAYELIQDYLDKGNPYLPCGHSGINNLGDDEFACNYEACDKVYPRERVNL